MWHLRMRNASQEHERVVGFFPIFSIETRQDRLQLGDGRRGIVGNDIPSPTATVVSVGVFLPNPKPK